MPDDANKAAEDAAHAKEDAAHAKWDAASAAAHAKEEAAAITSTSAVDASVSHAGDRIDNDHTGNTSDLQADLGKAPVPAAASGAEPTIEAGFAPLGQGAQVVLTGDAQAAARGGTHDDIAANTAARDEAILAGHVAAGTTAAAAADATSGLPVTEEDPLPAEGLHVGHGYDKGRVAGS
jgi:hypothetical protein